MPYVTVGRENSSDIDLYFEDHGPMQGQPIVLIHGYPLSGASWEKQIPELLDAGHRVITYDRRGFGMSSQPAMGYDYDTFTSDLNMLMDELRLSNVVLAGFSMGTGEVTHYLGSYGSDRIDKAVLFSPLAPYLLKTDENPEGVPEKIFTDIKTAIRMDRFAYLMDFFHDFYNVDVFGSSRISDEAVDGSFTIASQASPIATYECVDAWCTDFRMDVPALSTVPTLLVQGTEDRILPIDSTGRRLAKMVDGIEYHEIERGPHNIAWTHADQLNPILMNFLQR